jgi:predicted nucleic acid-binding protein
MVKICVPNSAISTFQQNTPANRALRDTSDDMFLTMLFHSSAEAITHDSHTQEQNSQRKQKQYPGLFLPGNVNK